MATEKDVYEVDTTAAIDALKKLISAFKQGDEQAKKSNEEQKKLADFLKKDLQDSLFSAQAGYDAVRTSISKVSHELVEAVKAFNESEVVSMRLNVALQNAGIGSTAFKGRLDEQASALQRLTGVQDENVTQLQTMLVTMGVGKENLIRFTNAAYGLAAATGQDATAAARLLARAMGEGKDELKRYNIEVDEADFKARGFAAVLEKAEGAIKGMNTSLPEGVKQMNALKGSFSDFQEAVGGVASSAAVGEVSTNKFGLALLALAPPLAPIALLYKALGIDTIKFTDALDGLSELITGKARDAAAAYGETVAKGNKIQEEWAIEQQKLTIAVTEFQRRQRLGIAMGPEYAQSLETQGAKVRALAEEYNKLGTAASIPLSNKIVLPEQVIDTDAIKKRIEAERAAAKQIEAERKRLREQEAKRRSEEVKEDFFGGELAAQGFKTPTALDFRLASDRQNVEQIAAVTAALAEADRKALAKQIEIDTEAYAARKQMREQSQDEMAASLDNWGQQFLGAWAGYLQGVLTSNTKFSAQMRQLDIERATAGMAEADAAKKRTEMEKKLQDERGAAFLKVTADALASIAVQAGTKALWEAAEAVASLALGPAGIPAATQHGIAAGMYAGVAVAAGGAAAGISAARGTTAEESAQLETAKENKSKEREAREKDQKEQIANVQAGTTITIINIGIAGKTEAEQGKELERVRAKYADLRTGS